MQTETQGKTQTHTQPADVDVLSDRLREQGYLAGREAATVAYLALRMQRPLLVEGPAGVGKTELAVALAGALGRELVRLQCYEGLDESRALYEWAYGKQLLYTQLLRDSVADSLAGATTLREAAERLRGQDDVFFAEEFLIERPLLRAIRSPAPVVLLIDELDRADDAFEALLLELLAGYQVTLPELGTLVARSRPLIVLTSNATRELSDALKRRALYLRLDYPDAARELAIVRLRLPGIGETLAQAVVAAVRTLRAPALGLRKSPSVSETLDWAQALLLLGATSLTPEQLDATLGALVKHAPDADRARRALLEQAAREA